MNDKICRWFKIFTWLQEQLAEETETIVKKEILI
jgi:hypothetical protein